MKFGSLFSGIGGFERGLERAGMTCAWQVEIDEACQRVLASRFQSVSDAGEGRISDLGLEGGRNGGRPARTDRQQGADHRPRLRTDVTEVGRHNLAAVDLICGGFPCQDLSVAGKRAGLAGIRSGLWFEFHRILAELRPRWVVIENVPGLLSNNGGADMAVVLGGLAELGYGWAYRVLNAQYFGVAQRRRRVFIVGHLGAPWAAPTAVLFEPESCGGNPPARGKTGEGVAAGAARSVALRGRGAGGTAELGDDVGMALRASRGGGDKPYVLDVAGTLGGGSGERGWPQDTARITFVPTISPALSGPNDPQAEDQAAYVAESLRSHPRPGSNTVGALTVSMDDGSTGNSQVESGQIIPTLSSNGNAHSGQRDDGMIVTHSLSSEGADASEDGTGRGTPLVAQPLRAGRWGGSDSHGDQGNAVTAGAAVRRLTPTECERLQGFPDGWTAGQSDSTRYRQLGNAVAVPVAEWIGRRIAKEVS